MQIRQQTSVGANATSANLLAGLPEGIIFPPGAYISLEAAVANGSTPGDITCQYYTGRQPLLGKDGAVVNVMAYAGQVDPAADTLLDRVAAVGQQGLYFTNSSAGAIDVTWVYTIWE